MLRIVNKVVDWTVVVRPPSEVHWTSEETAHPSWGTLKGEAG